MHFHRIHRKRAEVPIVPMIDILFILLVFFIARELSAEEINRHRYTG